MKPGQSLPVSILFPPGKGQGLRRRAPHLPEVVEKSGDGLPNDIWTYLIILVPYRGHSSVLRSTALQSQIQMLWDWRGG